MHLIYIFVISYILYLIQTLERILELQLVEIRQSEIKPLLVLVCVLIM